MNNIVKIFALILVAGFISSCAKDEVEAPSYPSAVQDIDTIELDNPSETVKLDDANVQGDTSPVLINDDGDDEDEDRTLIITE